MHSNMNGKFMTLAHKKESMFFLFDHSSLGTSTANVRKDESIFVVVRLCMFHVKLLGLIWKLKEDDGRLFRNFGTYLPNIKQHIAQGGDANLTISNLT
jgi:hypothetical protein